METYLRNSTQYYSLAWTRVFSASEREQMGGDIFDYSRRTDFDLIEIYGHFRGVSQYRAIIELGRDLDYFTAAKAEWLLQEVGEEAVSVGAGEVPDRTVPHWDCKSHVLTLRGEKIRTVKRPKAATNIILVLETFEEEGWPPRIDDPLPGGRDQQRLHATIRSLKTGLRCITFYADGTGEGFAWRRI